MSHVDTKKLKKLKDIRKQLEAIQEKLHKAEGAESRRLEKRMMLLVNKSVDVIYSTE